MRSATGIGAFLLTMAVVTANVCGADATAPSNKPPGGFVALFNGNDLSGWRGLGHTNPYDLAKWTPEQRQEKRKAADEDMRKHWRVADGQIINDGHGVYLTTQKDYGDFELLLDWRMMTPKTDSGVYLRGSPQVQIWDPENRDVWNVGADKGSGALWNNNAPEGKFPLVKADKPVGEWNTMRIRMVGERVTVHLNGQLTVEDAVMENYWDRSRPLPARGPIQLQTHGGEMRFANVFLREIPPEEANRLLAARGEEGFTSLFNGRDLDGWTGETGGYEVKDGAIVCKPGGGGTLHTKDMYGDFAIRFEFKLPPGGNNGLGIRYPGQGHPSYEGIELQILDDSHPKYHDIKEWQVHGSAYGLLPAHRGYLRPAGEWNYQEVVVKGPRIQVFVNGTKVLDGDLSKVDKPLDGHDHPGAKRTEGYVGFLGHGDAVAFRNIRIKPLR